MNINYDWVVFDHGGTLTTETGVASEVPQAFTDIYGKILREWFLESGYSVSMNDHELQKLSELAHENTDGNAGQNSMSENIDYYLRWMEFIYKKAGIAGYVTRAELEMARLFILRRSSELKTAKANKRLLSLLDDLTQAGIKMGVISNNNGYVEDALFFIGINHYFRFVIDSARVGICKPDRRIFDLAVEQNGLNGKRLLYVGDNYQADALGAINAGWDAAWITQDIVDPAQKIHVIRNLDELRVLCFRNELPDQKVDTKRHSEVFSGVCD